MVCPLFGDVILDEEVIPREVLPPPAPSGKQLFPERPEGVRFLEAGSL